MATEQETIEGSVTAVIFQNEENGYTVLRLKHAGDSITAVGTMPGVCTGEKLLMRGRWSSHPTYGRQFKAEHVEQYLPTETESIYDYLAAGVIKGIGPKLARRLVDRYGPKTFEILESAPEKLAEMKGLSLKKARAIQTEFLQRAGMRALLEFLSAHSMPPEIGLKLWRIYGRTALDQIRNDPYLLVDPELNIRFQDADHLAHDLGLFSDDPRRIEAGLYYVLTHNMDLGHVFLPRQKLLEAAVRLLYTPETVLTKGLLDEGLEALQRQGKIQCEPVAGVDAVYRSDLYDAEVTVADRILELSQRELLPPKNLEGMIRQMEREQGITYAQGQRESVALAARVQVMLLTGGPGTGKTTSLRGILNLFDALGLKTALAAPTGRAAKRLSELCGTEATTIHRLLEAGYDNGAGDLVFSKDAEEPLDADAVIVDEVSMVDISLMAALLSALKNDCRLVLVGDPDQLPSVGPGQVFDHLIRSGAVPTVRLTEIFRQARQSAIVMGAHAVNQGELPPLQNHSKDFFFLRRLDGEQAVETIVDLCQRRLPQHMGISPENIQVLSPTRKYITGTASLNKALQAALNPPSPEKQEKKFGSLLFRQGDRVMQIHNNYDVMWREADSLTGGMGIFNGDTGVIESIDADGVMTVNFDGRLVEYTSDMLSELEPAFAMTVHKAQGSEYSAVILAAVSGAPMLLTREVLYTAITRAKDLFIVVGDESVIGRMVANHRQSRRYSGLRFRLMGANPPDFSQNGSH